MIRRRTQQLLILGFIILIVAVGVNTSALKRIDLILYDTWLSLSTTKPPSDVVIIAIDEKSIDKLGRWPWPRTTHAELLDQLTEVQTKAVGFDIIFSEMENIISDQAFSDSIARHGNIILAVAPDNISEDKKIVELLPTPIIAYNSNGIGHVDTELDVDGISRQVYLYAGLGDAHWPAFGLALQKSASGKSPSLPFELSRSTPVGTGWVRHSPFMIPFYGPPGHIQRYSYIDVLNGAIKAELLKDKIVLVGATASGMGDAISTPVSGQHQQMPGVELNANITAALLESRFIVVATPLTKTLITLALAFIILPISMLLPRRYFPLSLPLSLIVTILLSWVLFIELRLWFAPTNAILIQLFFFLLISWRRYSEAQNRISILNKEVYQQLNFDPLTHLPNKTMFKDQLTATLESTEKGKNVSLLIIHLGGIKEVNNRLGLNSGDKILSMAAQQIKKGVDHSYPVARLSGIEFAVMLTKQEDHEETEHIGRRLIQLLQLPCELEGEHFFFKPSIGVSIYPDDGIDTNKLLSNAYTAMHKAKSNSKRGLFYYSLRLKEEILNESSLTRDLHLALNQNQLEVYYQPQVLSSTGVIIGFEALLRWKHPERGLIPPSEFIPIAEKTGLIMPIGDWVMETACEQIQQWNKKYNKEIRIAVNISAIQFFDNFLVHRISNILKITGLSPHLLELELTETALMQDFNSTIDILHQLKEMGINIAVDDFGTGYSSLSYLKQFPLDRIKIDQSFVRDLDESSESVEITQAIITMAHNLNLQVIAEGVETAQQRGQLLTQTCEELQGFYFSKPLPKEKINALLQPPLKSPPHNEINPSDKKH
ncbi:EAL domain-containing protein [Neptuniibacter sp. UBA6509]|uniref:EAL domain-containing protein n=3 Tax=unclassified Neptuniibacter TaxID=2630693 RepID=UPI000C62D184|nr:EAL domain-containing protein [Neptuniibacter sp. UBA6509]MAY40894.1 hypothetical protein [Oceanospirillaceae bacterium]